MLPPPAARRAPRRPRRRRAARVAAPAPDPLAPLNAVDIPAPAFDAANQAISGEIPRCPQRLPHLVSPENLPPGTTMDPPRCPTQSANVTYLKELWHAVQTQDITGKDALLALTQRPLTTPDPEHADGPGGAPVRCRRFRRRSRRPAAAVPASRCRRSLPDPALPPA